MKRFAHAVRGVFAALAAQVCYALRVVGIVARHLRQCGPRYTLRMLRAESRAKFATWLVQTVRHHERRAQSLISQTTAYQQWIEDHGARPVDLAQMQEVSRVLAYQPLISVVMPVYNPPEKFLREAIDSIVNQVYPFWELCLADDCSTKPYVREVLDEYAARDSRVKVVYREKNGHISHCSNSALELATGEYVALVDHDDIITPDALYRVALFLNKQPDADMIYSDEDKIDAYDVLSEPFFKPDWCPDSFLSRMYICHLGVYRRSIMQAIGGFRPGYEGSQDYDMVLRFTEQTDRVYHIPHILYHWRIHPESAASGHDAKPYAIDAARRAIADAVTRRGEPAVVRAVPGLAGMYEVRYDVADAPMVSIIVTARRGGKALDRCLESIFAHANYPSYEVIIDDHALSPQAADALARRWAHSENPTVRMLHASGSSAMATFMAASPPNTSQARNLAAAKSSGEYLIFLDEQATVSSDDWIKGLVEQIQRESIGAAGALLLYPDETIHHAGIVLGIDGATGYSHQHQPFPLLGYCGNVITISNVTAVCGLCLACSKTKFSAVGGFDGTLGDSYSDVDLCLKMLDRGLRNIYLPHVVLYYHQSQQEPLLSSTAPLHEAEFDVLKRRWQTHVELDPCYSPHLNRARADFSIQV